MTISCHFFVWLNAHRNSILRQALMPPITQVNLSKRIRIGEHCHILSRREPEKFRHWHHRRTSLFVQRGNYLSITANVYFCLECNVGFGVSWFIVVKVKPFWSKSPVYWLVIMVFRVHFTQPQPKNGPKTWNRIVLDGKLFMSGWTLFAAPLSPAVNVILISTLPLISFSLYFLTVIVR